MRALVLGGSGFIGSHVTDALLARDCQVRSLDRILETFRDPLPGVEYITGRIDDAGQVAEALHGIDIVFHLVSTTLPETSNDDPVFDVESNLIATLRILDLCVRKKVGRIVYVSSGGAVYGIPDIVPTPEDSPTHPISSYGVTKLAVEKYLHLYRRLHGLDYVVVRPSNPYGPRQNPDRIQGAVGVFLGRLLRNQPIRIWGDGSVTRDYIYVGDLAEGICAAAFGEAEERIFNLGSGAGVSLRELVAVIEKVTQVPMAVEYTEGRVFDVPRICLDISRAETALGWKPRTELRDGIREAWRFMQDWAAHQA